MSLLYCRLFFFIVSYFSYIHTAANRINSINQQFLASIQAGDQEEIADLFYANATINCTNTDGASALTLASLYNEKALVQFLLENKATINHQDKKHDTPLICASFAGIWDKESNRDTIKLLVEAKANPLLGTEERTPLEIALHYKLDSIVPLLLAADTLPLWDMRFNQLIKRAQDKKDEHLFQSLLQEKELRTLRLAHKELDPLFCNEAKLIDLLLSLMSREKMSLFLSFSAIASLELKLDKKETKASDERILYD